MPSMTLNTIGFETYQPDPEDICSLCGGNFGKEAMVEGKDKIHICMDCVDLLGVMKKERDDKKRDEATHAMASAPKPCGHDIHGICCEIYDAIAAGKIPHIRID
ncbi:MAG: hypothetical protein EOM46_21420 [Gammaproteobacteria bacterium]|nr:hypothetical protein [Gammaproteobacteria bacterium]